jgi:mRNA-degrading endonuclease toxin of MazEF toxin-antitoxin module
MMGMDNEGMETIFKFIDWLKLKIKLDSGEHRPPIVHEGDIWWVSFGKNVGSEINGKSEWFSRHGVIIKKLSVGFYLVAPTTSKIHHGNWYIRIRNTKKDSYVCLHQVRTIDYRRLSNKAGQVESSEFITIKERFYELYK